MNNILIKNIVEIFLYEDWANQKLVANIKNLSDEEYGRPISIPFNSAQGLLQHLYHYQEKYFKKITKKSLYRDAEFQLPRNVLSESIMQCSKGWLEWAKELDENFLEIEKNFQDIIYLFAHNNYHRGQLQVALSFLGHRPESIDVFLYKDIASQ